jgi:hypothetical protein
MSSSEGCVDVAEGVGDVAQLPNTINTTKTRKKIDTNVLVIIFSLLLL